MRKNNNWQSTTAAAQSLGISPRHLKNLKNGGAFKLGKHYRDIRGIGANRATYQWHVTNIEKLFNVEVRKKS